MSNHIIGIDVGSSKICGAAGKYDNQGKFRITGVATSNCRGLKKGKIENIDDTVESIRNAISQLENIICNKITSVYVSIPAGQCEIVRNKAVVYTSNENGKINNSDVEKVIKAAGAVNLPKDKEVIGVIPQKYFIDGRKVVGTPIGMSGYKLETEAIVFVTESKTLDDLFKCFEKLQIEICGLAIQPIVTLPVVSKKEETISNILLLDVGAETTTISIFNKDKIAYTNTFSLGGNTITNDISICLKLSPSQAEKLKIQYGSIHGENENFKVKVDDNSNFIEIDHNLLSQIIKARIDEILKIVKGIVDKEELNELFSSVIIIGGGITYFKDVKELCESILGKPSRIGIPDFVGVASPIYANAVGIVNDIYLSNKPVMKVEKEVKIESQVIDNKKENNNSKENSFVSKLKKFFTDFF